MKDALDHNYTRVNAGPDAPPVATCPDCGGTVALRSRRTGKNAHDKTWFYRHRRGEGRGCPRLAGAQWQVSGTS